MAGHRKQLPGGNPTSGDGSSAVWLFRVPSWVRAVAVVLALLHLVPLWHGVTQTPSGWRFTGETDPSPDAMQYRAWMRQAQHTGVLVSNKFTPEPTHAYIPVLLYWVVGRVGSLIRTPPEYVYAYFGALLAACLVVLLYWTVRLFLPSPEQVRWAVLVILFGGGLGATLRLGAAVAGRIGDRLTIQLAERIRSIRVLEADWRGTHVVTTIFDTHYLFVWSALLFAILVAYRAIRRPSAGRLLSLAAAAAVLTFGHVYSGVTLVGILAAVVVLVLPTRVHVRGAVRALATGGVVVGIFGLAQLMLWWSSGLPVPRYTAVVHPLELLLSFPVGWALVAFGLRRYLHGSGLKERFLAGWLLGCTALTLSASLYPYGGRAIVSLQVPLYVIGTAVYFRAFGRPRWRLVLIGLLLLGATFPVVLHDRWKATTFSPDKPYMFQNADHRAIIATLAVHASPDDLLIVPPDPRPRQDAALWLAPEFPGRMWVGHWFLTSHHAERVARANRFFTGTPEARRRFLEAEGIRFILIPRGHPTRDLRSTPGVHLLIANSAGKLYRYDHPEPNRD